MDENQLDNFSSDSDSDDDEEIKKLILSEGERKLKTIIWNNLNKDWLLE